MVLKKVKSQVKSHQLMQKLALFLLLATVLLVVSPTSIFAQDMSNEDESEDDMTEDGSMDEATMEDDTTEDGSMDEMATDEEMADDAAMASETMMETTMDEDIGSPLEQMAMGIDPHEIQCESGQKLVFKASNWRPACVTESSYGILLERGWVSSHDPSHDELSAMVNDYLATLPVEEEPEAPVDEGEIEIEEGVSMEGETDTGENQTETQSYTIDLRESMEMGAQ
jgi:hypothetical protein